MTKARNIENSVNWLKNAGPVHLLPNQLTEEIKHLNCVKQETEELNDAHLYAMVYAYEVLGVNECSVNFVNKK